MSDQLISDNNVGVNQKYQPEKEMEQFHDISLSDGTKNTDDDQIKNEKDKSDVTIVAIDNNNDADECKLNDQNYVSIDTIDARHNSSQEEDSLGSTPLCSIPDDDDLDDDEEINTINELRKRNGIFVDFKQLEEKYENKIIDLQLERNELQNEIEDVKRKLTDHETLFNETKTRLSANIDRANKQLETSRKELESMVMRYATSEKEVIVAKKAKDEFEKKLRDAIRDKEALMVRIKGLSNEKSQLMSNLDKKVVEISNLQKDYDKLKDDVKDRDAKWKQTQNKLKDETNSHHETQRKYEDALQRISELITETEDMRKNYQKAIENDEHKIEDAKNEKTQIEQLQNDIESIKRKFVNATEENHKLTTKIQTLERERLDHEQTVSKLRETVEEMRTDISEYVSKLNEMDQLRLQLEREKLQKDALQRETERLNTANSEMKCEMDSCRHKEGELLEFTERLTAKTVQLQSEHNIIEQKNNMLQNENDELKKHNNDIAKENADLTHKMAQAKEAHHNEITLLAKKLAEKTKVNDELKIKIDEIENENRVMRKRHVVSLKELNKELLSMRKRLEQYEGQISHATNSDSVSMSSRTSSSNSLDTIAGHNQINSVNNNHSQNQSKIQVNASLSQCQSETNPSSSVSSLSSLPEVDKQMLIERIIRLQKSLAKRNDKIDFLEEHNHQLMEDLKKKTKIIHNYILREETGALSTTVMDDHKRQHAKRGGGIMASLYNSAPNDATMTLELSLEINKKLQEVLEDTLLKNITLKENMNTLGDEIAKLKINN